MTAPREPARTVVPTRPRRIRLTALRRRLPPGSRPVSFLVVLALVMGAGIWAYPADAPLSVLIIPLLLGSLLLGPRPLPWFVVFMLVLLVFAVTRQEKIPPRTVGAVVVVFVAGFIILLTSFRRTRLGVAGYEGESMLVDLRDRILGQAGMPPLPDVWYAEAALRSAGGTLFAGDFVVAHCREERLEVVVVDVSGKGAGAGTRGLLLSGAFGGLLGALPPSDFLPAANDYLLRQNWDEGFATAVHLSVELDTGEFELRSAGHPPAAQRAAGSGRWAVHQATGPALGLIEDADFPLIGGTIRSGDTILLYTDGMVETPSKDIGLGLDKMLGRAEQLLRGRFDQGASMLIEALGSRNDDRALLLIHRR